MIDQVQAIAEEAGRATLEFFRGDVQVREKEDRSPLTEADQASHQLLVERLRDLDPRLPVLSEESSEEEKAGRFAWERYWLVDPLDGTKEFLKGTGEFTVNVALIEAGRSVLGVVHQPTTSRTYRAVRGGGAWRILPGAEPVPIRSRRADPAALSLVLSVSHASEGMKRLVAAHPEWQVAQAGSSLKFCLVAEGSADVYPRMGPTMEWDTGAAQCVVEEAGALLLDLSGEPLGYNKPSLRNPSLVTVGDPDFDWRSLVEAAQEGA